MTATFGPGGPATCPNVGQSAAVEPRSVDVGVFQRMSALATESGAVNLSQGIPDNVFDARWSSEVRNAATASWQYTATRGDNRLRASIAQYSGVADDAILVTAGCTEALLCALVAVTKTRRIRRVVFWEPYYPYYPGLCHLAGCEAIACPLQFVSGRFAPDWSALRTLLQQGDALFLANVPHNPTGMTLAPSGWTVLADLCDQTCTFLVIDDVYREFSYEEPSFEVAALLGSNVAIAGAISKTLAATGARLGWLIGESTFIQEAHWVHMHVVNCLPQALQTAASHLLREAMSRATFPMIRERYGRRRDRLTAALDKFGLTSAFPAGGHFVLARCPYWLSSVEKNLEVLCEALAYRVGVVPLPATGFFRDSQFGWLRFSFAVSDTDLDNACGKLAGTTVGRAFG